VDAVVDVCCEDILGNGRVVTWTQREWSGTMDEWMSAVVALGQWEWVWMRRE
jgi:hypothetical protein